MTKKYNGRIRKLSFLGLMFVVFSFYSCDKNEKSLTDGLEGYYFQYYQTTTKFSDRKSGKCYEMYRGFYLDGSGNGLYYPYVAEGFGYWYPLLDESQLIKNYYYQAGCAHVMYYKKVGTNINVICPDEGTVTFELQNTIKIK
ncbi:MAG: hypothetical protein MJZ64_05555 [Paludibacteraceae bacterium]|nr:hypothetical protein [Paludibacteraceae bacterium]